MLCNLSHLSTWRKQPRTGIDHALAGIGWANQTDDGRLQAYAYDVAARAYAMDRQDRATGRAIEQARVALADVDESTDTYAYFFSVGQLAGTESVCYLQLGQADKGIEAAKRSLAGIDGSFVRNLALTSLRLGICYLHREEPDVDRAASAIGEAACRRPEPPTVEPAPRQHAQLKIGSWVGRLPSSGLFDQAERPDFVTGAHAAQTFDTRLRCPTRGEGHAYVQQVAELLQQRGIGFRHEYAAASGWPST